MSLTRVELRVLSSISGPTTLVELSEQLGLSKPRLSLIIKSLKEKGMVTTERINKRLWVAPANNNATIAFRKLQLEFPYIDFAEIINGKTLEVLYALSPKKPMSVEEIVTITGVTARTVYYVLDNLSKRSFIGKKEAGYFLNPRFGVLHEFAREFFNLQSVLKAKKFAPDAVVIWNNPSEFILASEHFKGRSSDNFQLTGFARFGDWGMSLISTGVYYYYYSVTKRELRIEDVIVHTLVITKGTRDVRDFMYLAVLMKAHWDLIDLDKLHKLAVKFGVSDDLSKLIQYLNREIPARYPYPTWEEFNNLYEMYFGGGTLNDGSSDHKWKNPPGI